MIYTCIEMRAARSKLGHLMLMDRSSLKHAGTIRLHEAWTVLCAGRDAPYRAEVTKDGIGSALAGASFVLEAVELAPGARANLRFRLAGSEACDLFGMELRGMNAIGLMEGDSRERIAALARACLDSGEVGVAEGAAVGPDGEEIAFEMILAPVRSDFGRLDRLLGAIHALDAEVVAPAARRCRLTAERRLGTRARRRARTAEPLPGFAEGAAPFGHAPLRTVDGGENKRSEPRSDHLKVVKDE